MAFKMASQFVLRAAETWASIWGSTLSLTLIIACPVAVHAKSAPERLVLRMRESPPGEHTNRFNIGPGGRVEGAQRPGDGAHNSQVLSRPQAARSRDGEGGKAEEARELHFESRWLL